MDTITYKFPNAVLAPNYKYAIENDRIILWQSNLMQEALLELIWKKYKTIVSV